ncbi:DUF4249 domain-containing protein [Hymenobacter sp. BT175]|uniref:DUF4249 domain-containing protein n=1 Tax=Hymenobacter translucens TaxID=2886507 RepID=UPI001D0DF59F|nr:DUF4249 domain-containing protein [Hymenobacter translucens]MCC2547762.1 DUF4249 domain-containing protein [Hymenobacter translucens]
MKPTLTLATTLATLALSACETTLTLPEPPHTPSVALKYTLPNNTTDSSYNELYDQRRLYVSNSQRVFSTAPLTGRTDATVEIRDAAGTVVERFRPVGQRGQFPGPPGFYAPTMGLQTQPGQTYTLRATVPGLPPAESTLTMPAPAVVESGSFVLRTGTSPGGNPDERRGRLTVVLQDNAATTDYYMAYARVLDRQGQPGGWSSVQLDYDSQLSVAGVGQFGLSSTQQEYSLYPFSDAGVNGQRLTLLSDVMFYPERCPGGCPDPGFIEVRISSITADTYNFFLSRRRYYDSSGNPLAEPAPLVSNIRPGYGLFGGATDMTYRIAL